MATSDGSKRMDPADPADATARRARTAAEQREARSSGSADPDVLVEEIERTREDLAETLDAIADKVSPKRVAARTKKQVTETVKDGAAEASATVKEKAADASAAVSAGAASLRSTAEHVKETVQDKVSGQGGTTPAAATPGALADAGDIAGSPTTGALDPAGGEIPPLPALGTASPSGSVTTYGASPGVPKEVLAGAGAALAVLLLVLRRRKRR